MARFELGEIVIQFVRVHETWAAPVVLILAFSESFAFLSLVVPATVILFAIGGLFGAASVAFWPVYAAAVAGAFIGDWLAFELALHYRQKIASVWPMSNHSELLRRGMGMFEKWGLIIVFIGRFFGPLRAAVPIVAGIMGMSRLKFQLANFGSAAIWAAGILSPGLLGVRWLLG